MGHRDYRKPGDLQVHIFQDRVEISNPGGLVGGLTLETLGTRSIPRNPLLFGMMQRMDLVEKVGSGLKRIRDMCRDHPCAQPIIEADQDWYTFTLQRSMITEQAEDVPGGPIGGSMGGSIGGSISLTDRQKEVLELIKANPTISRKALAKELSINPSAVDKHLDALKNKGVLKRIGGTRGHWDVSGAQ
jgi:ATP-dependent DNA helicase RecG